jgi:RNA polymerase sigma-70 factor (ECF subfamily)
MLSFILMVIRRRVMVGTDVTDEVLMERYRDGDVDAFEVLLHRHERKLFNFIYRLVGHREKANDLLQETFLRVVKNAQGYTRKAKFTTWLYTIARNASIDELRKMKLRRHKSFEQPTNPSGEGWAMKDRLSGSRDDGFHGTDAAEVRSRINEAMNHLSQDQREVFVMREIMQMRFKEIAEVVGTSENTIKSRMRYALENMRLYLSDYVGTLPGSRDPIPHRSKA